MASVFGMLRSNAAYFFILVGLVWAAVGVLTGTLLVAWPAVACIAGGVLLKMMPGHRLTWAWVVATAAMGFLISVYQLYAWAPFAGGFFSALAGEALAGFGVFAVVHVVLLFAGVGGTKPVRSETS